MSENDEVNEYLCDDCDCSIEPNDINTTANGKILCSECCFYCDSCEEMYSAMRDDPSTVDGNETWCERCVEHQSVWCCRCETRTSSNAYYVQDAGEDWCHDCVTDNANYCDECDEYYAHGCDNCTDGRMIHDYSYRPDPIFRSVEGENTKLYFGIEIETEAGRAGSSLSDCAEYASTELENEHGIAYLKHDGSLDNGFEIVTHPASHAYYKRDDFPLWNVLERLRGTMGMKSWDTKTCGLHVHISRAGFSSGAHQHRFLQLVYGNENFYSVLAGREASHWAKFDDVIKVEREFDNDNNFIIYNRYRSYKRKLPTNWRYNESDRYSAVNTLNRHTLEMRIFRGSINSNTVKSAIDLAHASVEYTRELRVPDVWASALVAENFMEYIKMNAELYPELNERMNRLFTLTNAE